MKATRPFAAASLAIILSLCAVLSSCTSRIPGVPDEPFGSADEDNFVDPPLENRPETWFHFLGDNVSREGVEADLQAISDAGISGVHWFHGRSDLNWPGMTNPVKPLSPQWEEMVAHMAKTARQNNLRLTIQTCPGWAMAGGPWIQPADAMRGLVWSRTDLPQGVRAGVNLPKGEPSGEEWRDYQDVCVLAFPTPEGDTGKPLVPADVKSSSPAWAALLRGDGPVAEADSGTHSVSFTLPAADVIRSLELPAVQHFSHGWCYEPGVSVRLEALLPGGEKAAIVDAALPMSSWQDDENFVLAVNECKDAESYVFTVTNAHPMNLAFVRFYSASMQNEWRRDAGRTLRAKEMYQAHALRSPSTFVDPSKIVDISSFCDADGKLEWNVPEGPEGSTWTVLRFGHVNLGYKNGPAPAEATGWECNKLDGRGARVQFSNYVGRLQKGPLEGLADGMLMDSWECRNQTWTPRAEEQFEAINGYALRALMPALAGYVIGDQENTVRFLTDWRRTLTDLYNTEFFKVMADQARDEGMTVQYETAGADIVMMDPLEYYKYADVPMCEFWQPLQESFVGSLNFKPIRPTASAAHIYGKKRVAAESFTSFALTWDEHWEMLKEVANLNMSEGVTHNVFHTYTHNPQVGFLPPGTSFGGGIGTPFLRGQTWWKYMLWFTDYLGRLSYMLERGKPVVDVLWYLGDEVGHKPDQKAPFPEGLKYDYCNPDVLLNRLDVVGGKLCTPEGLCYNVLWIPENERMLPGTVAKLRALISKGARVVAGPPSGLATLRGGDDAEASFQRDVEAVWTERGKIRKMGKGFIAWDVPLEEALASWGIAPRLVAEGGSVLWNERQTGGARWFFVAAPVDGEFHGDLKLLSGGKAEWWDPVTGTVSGLESEKDGDYTRVKLDLCHAESGFLVLRDKGALSPVAKAPLKGGSLSPSSWTVSFPEGWGAPAEITIDHLAPWKDLPLGSEGRAFSGTARYKASFELSELPERAVLDLGKVDMLAEVSLNGEFVGMLWTSPYSLDVTEYLREGTNELAVEVTSTWYNRLVYDASLPEAQRKTWTLAGPAAGSPLRESGLIGPVTLNY